MLRKKSEMITDVTENARGGNGRVISTHILTREEMKGRVRLFDRVVLNPGCSIGVHQHVDEAEAYYILKGKGIMTDNGRTLNVEAGDVVITEDNGTHSIENTGDEPLEFIAVIIMYK